MYSHDTMGLGHFRRNLMIANSLRAASANRKVLMISGASEATLFGKHEGVDLLTVPSLCKVSGNPASGSYASRSLDLSLEEMTRLRANSICAALEGFRPHVLIADKEPLGALGELAPALEMLRDAMGTKCVLGLRDILDEPEVVEREWREARNEGAIGAYYDAVWVYGDRSIFDPICEYKLSDAVAENLRFTGYLDRRDAPPSPLDTRSHRPSAEIPRENYVLCTSGGGEDGGRLARIFARTKLPPHTCGVILTGPFMPRECRDELKRLAGNSERLRIIDFVSNPLELFRRASRVITMGGYNTICELVSLEQRVLVVPRVEPRREQLIRAERFSKAGFLDLCHPRDLSPGALRAWLERSIPRPRVLGRADFGGLSRISQLLDELLESETGPRG